MAYLLLIQCSMKTNDALLKQVFELTRRMIILSDKGNAAAEDDGCRLLYGVLQDCAYKIRMKAETERDAHQKYGKLSGNHKTGALS